MDLKSFILFNWIWLVMGLVVFLILVFTKIRAPYGRHSNKSWGALMPNKLGWIIMETPALLLCPLLAIFGPREKDTLSWILIGMWLLHYINRTLIFPMRIKTKGKKISIGIVCSAIGFNSVNGFINGYFIGFLAPKDFEINWVTFVGVFIFFTGFIINNITDTKLINLRKNNQNSGYKIPRGWLFEYISCPNHFGEMIEWIGFAITAMSFPGWTFAIWTICNLIPRTLNHHAWYNENFEEYPKNRKAFLPSIW